MIGEEGRSIIERNLADSQQESRERPTGVTLIAGLNFIGAGFWLILLLLLWSSLGSGDRSPEVGPLEIESDGVGWFFFVCGLQAVVSLLVGIGLWRMKTWGWLIAVVGYSLNFAFLIISNFGTPLTGGTFLALIASLGFVVYLSLPQIREAFEASSLL